MGEGCIKSDFKDYFDIFGLPNYFAAFSEFLSIQDAGQDISCCSPCYYDVTG